MNKLTTFKYIVIITILLFTITFIILFLIKQRELNLTKQEENVDTTDKEPNYLYDPEKPASPTEDGHPGYEIPANYE